MTLTPSRIFDEMMVHPAIFTHPKPRTLAFFKNDQGLLHEAMKHTCLERLICIEPVNKATHDPRVISYSKIYTCLQQENPQAIDILIWNSVAEIDANSLSLLNENSLFVRPAAFTVMDAEMTQSVLALKKLGFNNVRTLTFHQPEGAFGAKSIMLASTHFLFSRIREKDIYNRAFQTYYYNLDMHKAALALPEFSRANLE